MPKKIPEKELEAIVAVIACHSDGIPVKTIREALGFELPPRMLQRRLALLIKQGKVKVEGRGRGSRYRLPTVTAAVQIIEDDDRAEAKAEVYVPISAAALDIKKTVRQPLQHRKPVGYNQDFLDQYRPNDSYYLPLETRQRLSRIGGSADSHQRPAGTHAQQILNRLLVDLSWNSSRLEGNTYSLLETERLLQLGENAEGKEAVESQMILNHKSAIELLVEQAAEIGFNRYTILNLHAVLSDNLLVDPRACGRLRTIAVGVARTVFHPLEVPQLIEDCFQQILDKATAINDPFEQAFFGMVHLPYLQPFEDVNKRVSRLAANIPLIRQNLSPLSFIDVPERAYIDGMLGVYELNRVELLRDVFVWAYERSCARYSAVSQSLGNPDPFRLKYRALIYEFVATVVQRKMTKSQAIRWISSEAEEGVPAEDNPKFIEVIESELSSLHQGNIARYKLRPSEFETWSSAWE